MVFNFLTFKSQGPQVCKNYTLGLSKIGLFQHFRVRGKGRHTNRFFHTKCLLDAKGVGGFAVGCFKKSVKIDY